MNRSLKLSMLIALALGSSQVMAVEFGQIQVKSALGQPLLAEIPLRPDSPAELQNLTVQLASSEEFARAGIVGGRTMIPLQFSVTDAGAGHPVIRITSSAPVGDPFLDLLIEVHGKAGKSVREYAILLDPPNAQAATAVAATPAPSQPVQRPKAPPAAAPVAARPKPATPAPAPAPKPAAPVVSNGQYGPVERGQTLSSIARSVAPTGADVQQVMLALQQANPDAFYRDNINALKSGAVLRVPTSAEAQAMTIAAAVAEVRRQNSDWRAGVPGKPTVVADAATRAGSAAAPANVPGTGDRLALVPAKEGSSAGTRGGAGEKASASLRQDLLRTQESLASLQQQSTDLKTRLKDLADINSKNERLLSLKDNEIAELQAKLAAARKTTGMPPAAASPAKAVASTTPAETNLETATASTVANAAAAPVAAGSIAAAAPMPAGASSVARTPASGASVATTPIATPAPAKPVEKPANPPAAMVQPWYMQTWAWAAGAGAIVLLILLAMLGRRRKSGAAASKSASSLADRFGSTSAADQDLLGEDVDQDELLDQLAEHPDDIGLHLELVTLYYSRRDVEHFEAAAEAMHAHITDPQQDEWQDVLHMGEDLVPGHPLFDHHAEPLAHDDAEARGEFNIDDYADESDALTVVSSMPPLPSNGPKRVSEYSFNFDLTQAAVDSASHPAPAPDDATVVAPLATDRPTPVEPAVSWHFDEADSAQQVADEGHDLGEFNDDPVDTKLDLARAYIDMGDAEGAHAMLGEVIKEGSQMQKDVAQRLLDSLH